MNAVLARSAMMRCFATLAGGSASRPWRRAGRPAHIIPLLLGLAGVLLALSPTALEAGEAIGEGRGGES